MTCPANVRDRAWILGGWSVPSLRSLSLISLIAGMTLLNAGIGRSQVSDASIDTLPGEAAISPDLPAPSALEPATPMDSIDPTDYSLGATWRTVDSPTPHPQSFSASAALPGSLQTGAINPSQLVTPIAGLDYQKLMRLRPPKVLGNGTIRLIFPLSIPAPISSIFGWRIHPISGEQRFHTGTDLAASLGTPVVAAYAGQVALADWLGGYGLTVVMDHNKGSQQTLYGHLSELFVKPGEWVKQGTEIGRVGSTGNSTGPHLHFEFRQLTPDGWVAMDAGQQLEYAMAQLIKALQVAQAPRPNQG